MEFWIVYSAELAAISALIGGFWKHKPAPRVSWLRRVKIWGVTTIAVFISIWLVQAAGLSSTQGGGVDSLWELGVPLVMGVVVARQLFQHARGLHDWRA